MIYNIGGGPWQRPSPFCSSPLLPLFGTMLLQMLVPHSVTNFIQPPKSLNIYFYNLSFDIFFYIIVTFTDLVYCFDACSYILSSLLLLPSFDQQDTHCLISILPLTVVIMARVLESLVMPFTAKFFPSGVLARTPGYFTLKFPGRVPFYCYIQLT